GAAVEDVGIQGVRNHVAVFSGRRRMPLAHGHLAVIAAAGWVRRRAFLLSAAQPIGKSIVRIHVVHLRRGLVVPGTPALAAVHGDDGALVAGQKDGLRVIGIDPDVLIIIAAGGAAETRPRFSAVGGFPGYGADHVNDIGVLGIECGDGEIAAPDAARRARIGRGDRPGFAGVVTVVEPDALFGSD